MKFSEICIRRPVLASMMSLALILIGALAVVDLPVRELPDVDPPIVGVVTTFPGASVEVVETEVTEILEEAINNIPGIKILTSTTRDQVSQINVEFELWRDVDVAAQDVRDRVSRVRERLPDDILEPIVSKNDSDARPVLWIGVSSDKYTPLELTDIAERQMKPRLQTVRGVSSVFLGGEKKYAVRLWLDSVAMAAHRITVSDVDRALREQNVELPSGRLENLDREMVIQTSGQLKKAINFENLILFSDGERTIRLGDVGRAEDGVEDMRTVARNNGKPCIFLGIIKQSKANTVAMSDGIRKRLEVIKPTLPQGLEIVVNYDQAVFVKQSITEVWRTLGIAFFLVVVVIFLFLGQWKATAIPAVTIPVSVMATFAILSAFGYSINILTMLALVLAIGIVVDDAIVVLENVYRHVEEGMDPMTAAISGMKEISFAVIATTVSLVAVFLPFAFQKSEVGRLFVELAVAVSGAVIVSTFVALTLAPSMSARLLKIRSGNHRPFILLRWFDGIIHWLSGIYSTFLNRLLGIHIGFRLLLVLAVFGILGYGTLFFASNLEGEYVPEEDRGSFLAFLSAPLGSTSEYTDRVLRDMEKIFEEVPEVEIYGCIVAPGFNGPGEANSGIGFVHLTKDREKSVQELVNDPKTGLRGRFFMEIEGAFASPIIPKSIGGGFNAPFQVVITGPNLEKLDELSQELARRFNVEGVLLNANSSFEINKPELDIIIDRDKAAALDIPISEISRTLQVLFGGLDLSRIKLDGKEFKVIAQLDRENRLVPEDLDQIYLRTRSGGLVSMANVVEAELSVGPNNISRYNRQRSATISGTPNNMTLGAAIEKAEVILAEILPPGYNFDYLGESRNFKTSNNETLVFAGLALLFVYMVLAAQFESLVHPFTVMLTVPLAAVGAMGALYLVAELMPKVPAMNINLFSQVGFVLLIGLATKNGILLVEFANQLREEGRSPIAAMVEAGRLRFRPIAMTALSTVCGLLPLAIGFGAGAETRRPMGVVITGGMLTSTFLTLFVVPVFYTLLSKLTPGIGRPEAGQSGTPGE
jgi:hydrophobe/amphiphile efflux-1 (HAE1) family protein